MVLLNESANFMKIEVNLLDFQDLSRMHFTSETGNRNPLQQISTCGSPTGAIVASLHFSAASLIGDGLGG